MRVCTSVITGHGYRVTGIEIENVLAEISRRTLTEQGFNDVSIHNKDINEWIVGQSGSHFDAIVAFCAIPFDHNLIKQCIARLSQNGRFVAPIGSPNDCTITAIDHHGEHMQLLSDCDFIGLR